MRASTHKRIREWTMVVAALGLLTFEALRDNGPRPSLLVLYGTMLGLPAFLQYDRNRKP